MAWIETMIQQYLRHVFTASFVVSVFAVIIMGTMYYQKPKRLITRRKAVAIQLITGIVPAALMIVDFILAALNGTDMASITNSSNVFNGMVWMYVVLLMIEFGVPIQTTRKFPVKLPTE
jgi:hypothetical protein